MSKKIYLRLLLLSLMLSALVCQPLWTGPSKASARDFCSDCFRGCRIYTGAAREVCMNGCVAQGCEIP